MKRCLPLLLVLLFPVLLSAQGTETKSIDDMVGQTLKMVADQEIEPSFREGDVPGGMYQLLLYTTSDGTPIMGEHRIDGDGNTTVWKYFVKGGVVLYQEREESIFPPDGGECYTLHKEWYPPSGDHYFVSDESDCEWSEPGPGTPVKMDSEDMAFSKSTDATLMFQRMKYLVEHPEVDYDAEID